MYNVLHYENKIFNSAPNVRQFGSNSLPSVDLQFPEQISDCFSTHRTGQRRVAKGPLPEPPTPIERLLGPVEGRLSSGLGSMEDVEK